MFQTSFDSKGCWCIIIPVCVEIGNLSLEFCCIGFNVAEVSRVSALKRFFTRKYAVIGVIEQISDDNAFGIFSASNSCKEKST